MPKPELYHWEPNANSGKPIIALIEKGVEFQSRYTDLLAFDQHKPEYLEINPNGTIPVFVHGDVMLAESTEMGEYIDGAFQGPSLRPDRPADRWRMRWWGKFLDGYFGPSLSMIGWSVFIGPAVQDRDPEELKRSIERIPLKERRDAWSMAIYNTFPEEALAESCMVYALPTMYAEYANEEKTPNLIDWLRRVYDRPAIDETFKLGRTPMAERAMDVRKIIHGKSDDD
jgi:glutathione S-transferase/GST-like protein